jgi:hypothetical protein
MSPDNEEWILEIGRMGIDKKTRGLSFSPREQLIHCVWVTYICMTNAGDLSQGNILSPLWKQGAIASCKQLDLQYTLECFSLPQDDFEHEYFDRFDRICEEIQQSTKEE